MSDQQEVYCALLMDLSLAPSQLRACQSRKLQSSLHGVGVQPRARLPELRLMHWDHRIFAFTTTFASRIDQ